MKFISNLLKEYDKYKNIISALKNNRLPFGVTGLSYAHETSMIRAMNRKGKPILFIAPTEAIANKMAEDLCNMGLVSEFYPSKEFIFHEVTGRSYEYEIKRLNILHRLLNTQMDVVVCCIDAALQRTIGRNVLSANCFELNTFQTCAVGSIIEKLLNLGYEQFDKVDGPGQFALRGGILDLFTPNYPKPLRIEFFGDEIDTISEFDVESQRRTASLEKISIIPSKEIIVEDEAALKKRIENLLLIRDSKISKGALEILQHEFEHFEATGKLSCEDKFINLIYQENSTLFEYFSEESLLIISEPAKVEEKLKATLWQAEEDYKIYLENGTLFKELGTFYEDHTYWIHKINSLKTIYFDVFAHEEYVVPIKDTINISVKQPPAWNGSLNALKEIIGPYVQIHYTTVILAGTAKNAQSISKDLAVAGHLNEYAEKLENVVPGKTYVIPGTLSEGFEYPDIKFVLITHSALETRSRGTRKRKKHSKALYSLEDLNIGDHVVHVTHGIGIFKGIHKIELQNIKKDYIKIEYAKGDMLYVPVTQLDLVDKYIGPKENCKVALNKLGSDSWQKAKARAKAATKDIANELIKLYSQRMNSKGHAFREDDELQRNFEAYFEYEETPDQLRCIEEIKNDMQSTVPMDRLLCGDVGFGKTEVAMRAAFKCVSDFKQCAILVPTTILAWQHYQTLLKRFENFPIKIELLSRFRTPAQQSETLKRIKRGETDIVVGTHKLVQKGVDFKDLGLAIIDEEQRFGVKQKEQFKNIAKNVDVLTLSATPIPRTLNMAMSGIRDMSTLEEAPQNRYPVQTYVLEYNQAVINEAIRKELRRGGQVYYLHNNVSTITQLAASLERQIPEAKVVVGHGKMSDQELSDVWQKILLHEADVLVCTTIIETGIDVKNVNTLIIDNADKMGLSQLHQIRGRVGRANKKAFAYFTFNKNKILSEIAQKRLAAIREFTEFGSGFKIAMRDLELRGAGNILSGNQHGHIENVGYDMYIKLLSESIKEEKGEPAEPHKEDCLVDVQVNAYIPESYISNVNQRIEMYRKISEIESSEDVIDINDELIDRFGAPPKAISNLIDIALIRNIAAKHMVKEIKEHERKVQIFGDLISEDLVSDLLVRFKGQISIVAGAKPHIAISKNEKLEIIEYLKEIFKIK